MHLLHACPDALVHVHAEHQGVPGSVLNLKLAQYEARILLGLSHENVRVNWPISVNRDQRLCAPQGLEISHKQASLFSVADRFRDDLLLSLLLVDRAQLKKLVEKLRTVPKAFTFILVILNSSHIADRAANYELVPGDINAC